MTIKTSSTSTRVRTLLSAAAVTMTAGGAMALPPVPVPAENPITESKRVLGKMLFWDEQLSASNTMACATCHQPARGGTDPRRAQNPGSDGVFNTADDVFASPGVIFSDSFDGFLRSVTFGLAPQVTPRAAPSPINAAYATSLFWDGRASPTFVDPLSGQTVIAANGALESQSVNPPVSSTEMGHDQIDWTKVTTKLAQARPLALATNLPSDVAAALATRPTYGELFNKAFGSAQVTASRVAMAIGTYERTLIADQTPFDLNTLTPQQQQGFQAFQASNCIVCHAAPLFTDNNFHNIGLRPPSEDLGRQIVTGNTNDRGKFKVPSLRNVGLMSQFMHNGEFTAIPQVIAFYAKAPGAPVQFTDNQDPVMQTVRVPPQAAVVIQDFITNGLTDPRVRNETFPFDHPTLYSTRPTDQPQLLGGGSAGAGGFTPTIIAVDPPVVGNAGFRIGLDHALPGASAQLMISSSPPGAGGELVPSRTFDAVTTAGTGNGNGFATQFWPLSPAQVTAGQQIYAQWIVTDPSAPGGFALSTVAKITFFCAGTGCQSACAADANEDLVVSVQDIFEYLNRWFLQDARADIDGNGSVTIQDIFAFLQAYFGGC